MKGYVEKQLGKIYASFEDFFSEEELHEKICLAIPSMIEDLQSKNCGLKIFNAPIQTKTGKIFSFLDSDNVRYTLLLAPTFSFCSEGVFLLSEEEMEATDEGIEKYLENDEILYPDWRTVVNNELNTET